MLNEFMQNLDSNKLFNNIGVQVRLHLAIQISLFAFFMLSQYWIVSQFDQHGIKNIEYQANETADGLINALNLLMVTGQISSPSNRKLLVEKFAASSGVSKLRLIRSDQINAQFGPGLSSEHEQDALVNNVFSTASPLYVRSIDTDGQHVLRAIIPYVASENFRGTNCLSCHKVKSGSVNGVADISMNLSEHEKSVTKFEQLLWYGMLTFQIILSVIISLFVKILLSRHVSKPVKQLQEKIIKIQNKYDPSLRISLEGKHPDIDCLALSFNSFLENLEFVTNEMMLFSKLLENSSEGIFVTDASKNIVFVNSAFISLTGYSKEEVLGRNPRFLKSGRHDLQFYKNIWSEINEHTFWRGEIYNRNKNGQIFPVFQSINSVKNRNGQVCNYMSVFMDISQCKAAEERVQRMANFDTLTGLANRNLLNDRVNQALIGSQRSGSTFAVMFLDLDNFKDINDEYGHAVGDSVLKVVSERLLTCIREGDTVARKGGDEFIILLPNIDGQTGASMVAEKIIHAVSIPLEIDDHALYTSASIGIAIFPGNGGEVNELINNADSAMYSAKQGGRNRYSFFMQEMNDASLRRIYLLNMLRNALFRNEFELHYQPQLDSISGKIVGAEALIRWRDPKGELISPAEFIPIAEASGLIISIGRWVLNTACQEAQRWHDAGYKITISVNVSGRQLKEADFNFVVEEALRLSGLESCYLELEMTEGVLVERDDSLSEMFAKLKNMGVKLALDDFGTEYSSLSRLKYFPIDRIKIDQSFVRDVHHNIEDAAIVDAIICIAHGLKMTVIAEGVETSEQFDFLNRHSCPDIQGYLISRPLPRDQVYSVFEKFSR